MIACSTLRTLYLLLLNPCVTLPIALVVAVFLYYRYWNHIRFLTRDIPGPPEFPLYGNINFFADAKNFWEIHNYIYRGFDKYGPIFKLWMAHEQWICICDSKMIQPICEYWKTYNAVPSYNFFRFAKDKGYMHKTFYGTKEHFDLKLSPTVTDELAEKSIKHLVTSLKSSVERGTLTPELLRSNIKESVKLFVKETDWQVRLVKNYIKKVFLPIQDRWDIFMWKTSVKIHKVLMNLVNKYHNSQDLGHIQMNTLDIDESIPSGGEFDGKCLSPGEINMTYNDGIFKKHSAAALDLAAFHMSESVDMVTTFLMNLLHEIAANPQVWENLRAEVSKFQLSHDGRDPTLADERKLRYAESVVKEGLRLYAPPAVTKRSGRDFTLGSQTVPGDSLIYICSYHMHMNHDYYQHPTKFHPDHFSFEVEKDRPLWAFFPLVMEPATCQEKRYFLKFLKLLLAELSTNFSLETNTKPDEIEHDYFHFQSNLETIDLRLKQL